MRRTRIPDRTSGDRGMSLFELMIVIVIISAISMVALPQLLEAREDYRLTAVAGEVVGVMNNARILSVTRNTDYRVDVTASDTYVLEEWDGAVWRTENIYSLADGFTIAGASVEFHPRGNATPVATLTITNPNGKTRDVVVEVSGRSYSQQ